MRPTMTPHEAMEMLDISPNTFYKSVRDNRIPHLRIGRKIVVLRGPLERMLGEWPEGGAG